MTPTGHNYQLSAYYTKTLPFVVFKYTMSPGQNTEMKFTDTNVLVSVYILL